MKELKRYLLIAASIGLYKLLIDVLLLEQFWVFIYPAILILFFGLPHGATDHLLDNFSKDQKVSSQVTLKFLFSYVGIIAIYALIWWISTSIALLLFLLMSAYHFGETQWVKASENQTEAYYSIVHYFLWGIALLGMLFTVHGSETSEYLHGLISQDVTSQSLDILKFYVLPVVLFGVSFTSFFFFKREVFITQLIEFSLFMAMFYTTDLIYGFAVFFGLFHSRDAIDLQIKQLVTVDPAFGWRDFYRFSWPFTLISLVGIALVLFIFYSSNQQINLITLFFIMISLVTAPHMVVIAQFYKK